MRQEVVNEAIWQECLGQLESEVNGDQFETYLRPLQADFSKGGLTLLAPNIYVEEKVRSTFLARITEYFESKSERGEVLLSVGGMREVKPLRSNWIGKLVDKPVLSKDKKNLMAKGIIK